MTTRRTTLSQRRLANDFDGSYRETWINLPAIFTTWEGERLMGTITHFTPDGMFPCVTFPDGKWARLNLDVEIVNG